METKEDILFSVILPVYACESCLVSLYSRLCIVLESITPHFELIFVNDGCPQQSWTTITTLAANDKRVKGINLSKNFGQHHAITAGLDYAQGDWIVVMDCDLQDIPEEIVKLYEKTHEGYDVVVGQRIERKDTFWKKMSSRVFYSILNYFTDTKHDASIANFGIYSKRAVQSINQYREQNRAFPLFVKIVGFKKIEIPINHAERSYGKSSYNFKKLVSLSASTILAHSNKPLRLSIIFGFLISFLSLMYAVFLFASYFLLQTPIAGWTSMMVSMFFMFGMTFSLFGILGLYIGKIFDEVKQRPLYIVMDTLNLKE